MFENHKNGRHLEKSTSILLIGYRLYNSSNFISKLSYNNNRMMLRENAERYKDFVCAAVPSSNAYNADTECPDELDSYIA